MFSVLFFSQQYSRDTYQWLASYPESLASAGILYSVACSLVKGKKGQLSHLNDGCWRGLPKRPMSCGRRSWKQTMEILHESNLTLGPLRCNSWIILRNRPAAVREDDRTSFRRRSRHVVDVRRQVRFVEVIHSPAKATVAPPVPKLLTCESPTASTVGAMRRLLAGRFLHSGSYPDEGRRH